MPQQGGEMGILGEKTTADLIQAVFPGGPSPFTAIYYMFSLDYCLCDIVCPSNYICFLNQQVVSVLSLIVFHTFRFEWGGG